jgi:hypothetical protein
VKFIYPFLDSMFTLVISYAIYISLFDLYVFVIFFLTLMIVIPWKRKTFLHQCNVLKVKCTFLDSEFSTLIEKRNSFQFSQAICAKTTSKLSCFKQWEISIMLISLYKCPVVTLFVSFLHVIDFFLCEQS